METAITVIIILAILGGAAVYLYRAKKRGVKCVGCPDSGSCSGNCKGCSGSCGCGQHE